MLPINSSYERTPEQETMAGEMNVGQKKGLGIGGLISWGWNVLSGKGAKTNSKKGLASKL